MIILVLDKVGLGKSERSSRGFNEEPVGEIHLKLIQQTTPISQFTPSTSALQILILMVRQSCKMIGFHEEGTLSVLPKTVLLPKRDEADAELKNTEEDRCGSFDRHCVCGKEQFELNSMRFVIKSNNGRNEGVK